MNNKLIDINDSRIINQEKNTAKNNRPHQHLHTKTKAISNRLSKAIGHLESVKRMVDADRDCSEVLIQLSAVRSALDGIAKIILKDHLEHCLTNIVKTNDEKALAELNKAIDLLIKK